MRAASICLLALLFCLDVGARATAGRQPSQSIKAEILKIKTSLKPYKIFKAKNMRFYLEPPGPCSCDVETVFECVKDIEKSLADSLVQKAAGESNQKWNAACGPAAGCGIGRTTIFVDCR